MILWGELMGTGVDLQRQPVGLVIPRNKATIWTCDAIDKQVAKRLHSGLVVSHTYAAGGWLMLIENFRAYPLTEQSWLLFRSQGED